DFHVTGVQTCALPIFLLSFTHIGSMVQDKWIAPKSADTIKNPYEVEPLTLKQGEEIYLLYCAPCHGDYGYGDGAAGGASGILPEIGRASCRERGWVAG